LVDLLQTAIELTRYREHLMKQRGTGDDLSEVTENLDELLAEAAELDQETNDDKPALEAFLEFAALQADTDRLKTDQDLVTLMTLHAAKGLEFPHVYIMAVEENILPHSRSKDDPVSLEEERRLFFVGITRAMDRLQISYAKRRGFSHSESGVPSSFLMELPRGDMQIVDQSESWGDEHDAASQFASSAGEWDEWSQLEGSELQAEYESPLDDDCQLPPDEIRERLKSLSPEKSHLVSRLMLGSELDATADEFSTFGVGTRVAHERLGDGEIVAIKGRGPKRSATIQFESDGSLRTFRLSHASLKVIA
jgi:DNA helicase-2/ATP-dependent DNA helicase PcrA